MSNQSYFGGIKNAVKTLTTGLKVTMKEYFTPKSTEQYPENRKTTLHVSARHRGRLVFKRVEDPEDPQAVKRGLKIGDYKCTACTMCEKACPNGTIKITSHMETDPETGRKHKVLDDYQYDLGDCMFCELCVNACNFDAIHFTNDFENAVFDRRKLVMHLDKAMANIVMFCILAVVILGSAVLSVFTRSIMRAATYLLFVLFGIAGIYFLLDYTYLGAAQISIYAGGITILYIFAISLVSKRTLQNLTSRFKGVRVVQGALISLVGLATVGVVLLKNKFIDAACSVADVEVPMAQVGKALVGSGKYEYVLPFEFISLFLLACIIGGIMIARKEDKK